MEITKKQLIYIVIFLLALFNLSYFFNLIEITKIVSLLFLFFIPGFLLFLNKKIDSIPRVVYAVASSVVIFLLTTIFLNLGLGLRIDKLFLPILFTATTTPLLLYAYKTTEAAEKFSLKIKLGKLSYIFILFVVLSIAVRVVLFTQIETILGADVGRFTIISHSYILKQEIVTDLRPYDLAYGYFYFPGPLILPMLLELSGFNPIAGVTISVFIFDIFSLFAYYLLVLKFFGGKAAVNAFFFYAFLFDILLNLSVFGVFPHGMSIFYLFLLLVVTYEIFFEKKQNYAITILWSIGLLSFHVYTGFVYLAFFFSVLTYAFYTKEMGKIKNLLKTFSIASVISLLLLSPYVIKFLPFFGDFRQKDNIADLMVFSYGRAALSFSEKIKQILLATPTGLGSTLVSLIGLIAIVFARRELIKTKALIFLIFLFFSTLFTYFVFSDYNLFRSVFANWIVYALALSLVLDKPYLNLLILPSFFFIESQSVLFLITHLVPIENPPVPWVIWPEFSDTMNFIKENVPESAIFLIDGGGAGCTGANPSYGERIFPLTSRRIFFFTDYCWSSYDKQEYQERVKIYREISINPDNKEALSKLKMYGVTHVYIGKYHVGLHPELFRASENYRLIYQKGSDYVFEIL